MNQEMITIDINKLRKDMKDDCYGAFFGGGFGGALFESFDIDRATPEELVGKAQEQGIDMRKYQA